MDCLITNPKIKLNKKLPHNHADGFSGMEIMLPSQMHNSVYLIWVMKDKHCSISKETQKVSISKTMIMFKMKKNQLIKCGQYAKVITSLRSSIL